MKISICLKIAAALAVSPLFLLTPALAGQLTTYSHTPQSELVLRAIEALREGKSDEFKSMLDEKALAHYGADPVTQDLRGRFERIAGGAPTSEINTNAELQGTQGPDTLWIIANRDYTVEVQGHAGDGRSGFVSVHCIGASLLDVYGKTNNFCKITQISFDQPSRDTADAQGGVSRHGGSAGKLLSDDTSLGLGIQSLGDHAGGARAGNR